jgi:hypothetical protein
MKSAFGRLLEPDFSIYSLQIEMKSRFELLLKMALRFKRMSHHFLQKIKINKKTDFGNTITKQGKLFNNSLLHINA